MMGTEGFSFWFLHWTPTNYRASPVLRLNSEIIYWVGQKVHLDFSIRCYRKLEQTIWPTHYVLYYPLNRRSFYHNCELVYSLNFRMKAEHQRTDAFELQCWRRFLRAPWTARKENQSILKELNPEYSLEGLMLKLNSSTLAT